jgi:hypothetical protein
MAFDLQIFSRRPVPAFIQKPDTALATLRKGKQLASASDGVICCASWSIAQHLCRNARWRAYSTYAEQVRPFPFSATASHDITAMLHGHRWQHVRAAVTIPLCY